LKMIHYNIFVLSHDDIVHMRKLAGPVKKTSAV